MLGTLRGSYLCVRSWCTIPPCFTAPFVNWDRMDCPYLPLGGAALKEKVKEKKESQTCRSPEWCVCVRVTNLCKRCLCACLAACVLSPHLLVFHFGRRSRDSSCVKPFFFPPSLHLNKQLFGFYNLNLCFGVSQPLSVRL